jgi:HEAT repeats
MFNIEQLVPIVLWLALTVLAIDLVFVLFIFRRRISRRMYYEKKDATIKQFSGEIRSFLNGDVSVEDLVATLENTRSRAGQSAIQELLLGGMTSDNRHAITEVFLRLGYIAAWAKDAFGGARARQLLRHIVDGAALPPAKKRPLAPLLRLRLFCVKRALAVTKLGQLDASFAEVFMRDALADPSPFVGRANVTAIGRNRNESGVSVLLELLRQAVESVVDLPVRSIKIALVRYPITDLVHFAPFLSNQSSRFRFVMVDSIREICDNTRPQPLSARDFPEDVCRWFLHEGVHDESVDVRARSAGVIRHFHTPDAVSTLRALLQDENEFVRLHAVRACADPYYSELVEDVAHRISDSKWRVREAAVATLATFGQQGRQHLAQHFLSTTDRYGSEQISEVMQRSGIIMEMLPSLAMPNGNGTLVADVCAKMVRLGSTSFLTDFMAREQSAAVRVRLMEILVTAPTPYLMTTMQAIAKTDADPLKERAHAFLQSQTATAAAAGPSSPAVRGRAATATGGDGRA